MKKADITVYTVNVNCPHCGEGITEPEIGSYNWDLSQLKAKQIVTCFECGKESQIPAWVHQTKL